MTRYLHSCIAAGALAFSAARADYVTAFSAPPYTVDQTVLGIEGWDHRLPTTADVSDHARVVAVRWNGYKPALMLKAANLKNAFAPTTGTKATITFDLAVNFPDKGGSLKQFRLGFGGAPCGEIFMDLNAEGGLGYQADGSGRGGLIALKKPEVKINSFYTFCIAIDYVKQTYEVSITGEKKDGTPFTHKAAAIAFESKAKAVSGLYLISGGVMTAYLGSLSIKSE